MTSISAKYQAQAVPRYTSYPTAPHFTDAVGAADQRAWLAALDPAAPVSLYLHVPFCRDLCWYCGCNMQLVKRESTITDYVALLCREIELVAAAVPARMRVSHIHWGGGTPTALRPDDLARVMDHVAAHFDIVGGAELAIESDPRTLSEAMAKRIGTLGFNRASFGVQEFAPDVQAAINRIQPPEMVRQSVDWLRSAGVKGINFDLIYGLPRQTVEGIKQTVDQCLTMEPNRIALFGYAHVPWMAKKQRLIDEATLPDGPARVAQFDAASAALVDAGYAAIGLDHFALPDDSLSIAARNGTLRRNFQGYTTDSTATMLGLGATSIGRTPSGYVQNKGATASWAKAVRASDLPIAKGVPLDRDDHLRGTVIEQIMCRDRVDLGEIGTTFGVRPDWYVPTALDMIDLVGDGLIQLQGDTLTVLPLGRPLRRIIAARFDAYLQRAAARHSVAV